MLTIPFSEPIAMPNPLSPPGVLDDALLKAMSAHGGMRSYPANTLLINEADHTDAIYILLVGRVKVFGSGDSGREVIYNTLGPGEYFGEMSLDGQPRSASVMTLEPVSCIVVTGAKLRDFLADYPDFAMHLIHKLIGLVRRSTVNIKSLALDDVHSRVVRVLEELAREVDGRLLIREKLTQQDMADRVGASREMVNRVLTYLHNAGYLASEGRYMVVLKPLADSRPQAGEAADAKQERRKAVRPPLNS